MLEDKVRKKNSKNGMSKKKKKARAKIKPLICQIEKLVSQNQIREVKSISKKCLDEESKSVSRSRNPKPMR